MPALYSGWNGLVRLPAVRNRPPNGRVIFGDDYVQKSDKGDTKELPFLKKFGDDRKKP